MKKDKTSSISKRKNSDQDKGPQAKKKKGSSSEDDDVYDSTSMFCRVCKSAGMELKNGNKYNRLPEEQAVFQRNLQKELRCKGGDEVIEKFIEGFQDYIEEPKRFHKSLLPCVTSPDCSSARGGFQGSLVKVLLGVDMIQPPLMTVLLEKLPEFFGEEDSTILEQGQKVNIPHLLLSQFQWLDYIVNSKEVTEKLLEMISITCVDIQREIIACLPDIVQDSEHTHVAAALRDILSENKPLTVPILDAMSNLILTPELLAEVRESVLQSLVSVDLDDLPVLVKFLLQSVTGVDALQVVSELRVNLELDSSTARRGKNGKSKDSSTGKQDTETLILDTIKSAVRFQKHVGDAFIKAIECVKEAGSHKVIDFFILLILHGTPRKKVVESVFRNKIRSGVFTLAYLKEIYSLHAQVLKPYFQSILSLSEVLLRSPELPVSYFGCGLYKQTFTAFDTYHQQEIVGNLVTHIGSGCEGEIDASLDILSYLVNNQLPKMAPFAIIVKSVLDYLDNLSVCQIRKLYFMLSALAFRNQSEGGLIQDDLHIVIRKQLSNSNPKYKRMGVIGAVMIVSCIAQSSLESSQEEQTTPDDLSDELLKQVTSLLTLVRTSSSKSPEAYSLFMDELSAIVSRGKLNSKAESSQEEQTTPDDLSDELLKQVTSLLTLVRTSSSKSPEAYSLFMDELSAIVSRGKLNSKAESWISENLTPDFQESFVVDVSEDNPTECNNIRVELVHSLDDDTEGAIAINMLPLVVNKYNKRTALAVYTESGVSDPLCMCPSVRLLRVCEERQSGSLENIDALLGCPVYMCASDMYDKMEPLSQKEKDVIISTLFYTINWFIEMVNGFSSQSDPEIKGKVITRLQNITDLQTILLTCLKVSPSYKPPLANFDLDEAISPTLNMPGTSKGDTKKKTNKKKTKKTGGEKDKVTSDSDDNSRDSSQMNNTTMMDTQAATQNADKTDTKDKSQPSLTPYKPFFREMDISVFTILNTGLITKAALDSEMNTKGVTELSLQTAQVQFLMKDMCRKLDHSLLATSVKRKSFFKVKGEKKVGFSNLDQLSPLQMAKNVIKLLPALCNHLEGASGFFQSLIAENDGMLDGPGSRSPEALMMGTCFQLLLQALLSIFSWSGFQVIENRDLLKEGLCVLVKRIKSTGHSQLSHKEIIKTCMQYIGNFANTVPDIQTAVTLLKLLTALAEKSEDKRLRGKLVPLADEFLKREWMNSDGEREKGAKFNEQLQIIIKTFIIYSDDPLSAIETIATKAMPELLEADKNGCSATYPTLNRPSYAVYFRTIYSELIEAIKVIPPSKPSETIEVWMDRLLRWNIAVRILHILVSLMKTFDGRSNIGTCIKYGRFFIETFLRLGMPLLDQMFRSHRADIQGLLKNLQLSTRALHHMCGHSKIMKDVALINQVPMLKRCLEGFVFRVKAMLTVNKCLEAFWMGNLKNRDLHGEEILSQSVSVADDNTTTAGDSDAETLPDDDNDLSDVELDNESHSSNDTGLNDVTDPEGSYSQIY